MIFDAKMWEKQRYIYIYTHAEVDSTEKWGNYEGKRLITIV